MFWHGINPACPRHVIRSQSDPLYPSASVGKPRCTEHPQSGNRVRRRNAQHGNSIIRAARLAACCRDAISRIPPMPTALRKTRICAMLRNILIAYTVLRLHADVFILLYHGSSRRTSMRLCGKDLVCRNVKHGARAAKAQAHRNARDSPLCPTPCVAFSARCGEAQMCIAVLIEPMCFLLLLIACILFSAFSEKLSRFNGFST